MYEPVCFNQFFLFVVIKKGYYFIKLLMKIFLRECMIQFKMKDYPEPIYNKFLHLFLHLQKTDVFGRQN